MRTRGAPRPVDDFAPFAAAAATGAGAGATAGAGGSGSSGGGEEGEGERRERERVSVFGNLYMTCIQVPYAALAIFFHRPPCTTSNRWPALNSYQTDPQGSRKRRTDFIVGLLRRALHIAQAVRARKTLFPRPRLPTTAATATAYATVGSGGGERAAGPDLAAAFALAWCHPGGAGAGQGPGAGNTPSLSPLPLSWLDFLATHPPSLPLLCVLLHCDVM